MDLNIVLGQKIFIVESQGNARAYAEALEYYRWRNSMIYWKSNADWASTSL